MNLRQVTSALSQSLQRLQQSVDRLVQKSRRGLRMRKLNWGRWLSMDLRELAQQIVVLMQKQSPAKSWVNLRDVPVSDWPMTLRWAIPAITFISVFGVAAFAFWSEPWQRLQAQTHEVELLKARYIQVTLQSTMRPGYEQQLGQIEAQFGEMLEMIPASLEIVQVLHQVSHAAQATGLRLQWFKPAPEIPQDAYTVMPVDIRLVGSYHAVGHFLEAVSRMKHLITVDVILEPVDTAPGQLALATKVKAYRGDMRLKAPPVNTQPESARDGY